jgi:trigger factor
MKADVKREENSRCAVEVTIEADKIDIGYAKYLNEAARSVSIHGFRKGKAPIKLVEKHVNKALIMQQVMEDMAPRAMQEALEKENLLPINEPAMEIIQFEKGKDFIFKTTFEVKPEIDIDGYLEAEFTQEKPDLKEEDVDSTLAMMQENTAQVKDIEEDRGLEAGDIALVDFDSFHEGAPVENGSSRNYLMELKEDMFIPGFIDNLRGMKKGGEKKFQATFPPDYASDLKGKTIDFDFKILGIKKKALSPLNDEFAKEVSKFQTLEELKNDLRTKLQGRIDEDAKGHIEEKIGDLLVEKVTVDLPLSLIDYEQDMVMDDFRRNFAAQGINLDQYLKTQQKDADSFKEHLKPQAVRLAKIELALDAIGKKENISILEEEVDTKIREIAGELKQDYKKLKENVQKEGRIQGLRYAMLKKKVMSFLVEKAKVTYVAPAEKNEEAPEPEKVEAKE